MHLRVVLSHGSAACIAIALGAIGDARTGRRLLRRQDHRVHHRQRRRRRLRHLCASARAHLPRFIAGHPAIVPKNQPGAGSGRAAAFLYAVAPKDGTAIGAVFPGAIMGPLLDDRAQPPFDPTRFRYLASADNATRLCVTYGRSTTRSFDDALRRKTIMGASAAGGSTRDYVNMHRKSTGAQFEVVAGYKGTAEIFLAMERGEVDGMCGLDWTSLRSQRPDWLRNKRVNILAQVNLEPEPELTSLGVPQIWRYIVGSDDRKAVELIIGQQVFGRPYLAPPGGRRSARDPARCVRGRHGRQGIPGRRRAHPLDVTPRRAKRCSRSSSSSSHAQGYRRTRQGADPAIGPLATGCRRIGARVLAWKLVANALIRCSSLFSSTRSWQLD